MPSQTNSTLNPMKKILLITIMAITAKFAVSQNILVVNDNDNITYNTDTLLLAFNHSTFSSYHYWSIPDSAGAFPTAAVMNTYDLVIWYCSTDGVGLKFWNGSASGNSEIVNYAAGGKPIWIIGLDILYQVYGGSNLAIPSGDFANDYMGLTSYDKQSYVDDGSLGVSLVDRISTASTLFPDTVRWAFPTLWYVDGCTPQAGTLSIYEMGPASYTLAGRKTMFHNQQMGNNVMSTFFDPALMDTRANRINFMQAGINYILNLPSAVSEINSNPDINIYPNPTTNTVNINLYKSSDISIVDLCGKLVYHSKLMEGKHSLDVSTLSNGIYFLTFSNGNKSETKKIVIAR